MLSNVTHSNSYFECNKKRGCIDQLYIELGMDSSVSYSQSFLKCRSTKLVLQSGISRKILSITNFTSKPNKCFVLQQSSNVSTTPITAMWCWQCLPLSVVQLKGKHCRKPHCCNRVVDTFGLSILLAPL